jgi:hypothetical protein
VRALEVPSIYFISTNLRSAKLLAAYYSFLIRGLWCK